MASTAFSAVTALISGGALGTGIGKGQTTASEQSAVITAPTGEALNLSNLVIRLATSAGSAYTNVTLDVGTLYSGVSLGSYSVTVPSNGSVIYVGGEDFESARFKNATAQSVTITVATGASAINYEAVLLPSYVTG